MTILTQFRPFFEPKIYEGFVDVGASQKYVLYWVPFCLSFGCLPSEIIILYKIYRYFILPSTYLLKFILLPYWECEDQISKSLSQCLDQDYNGNSINFIVQIAAILTSTTGRPPTTEYRMTGCMRLSCSGPGSGLVRVGSLQLKPCSAGLNVSVNSQ